MSKIAIVTGANKGIGFEVAKQLAETGVKVILACRSESLGKEAVSKLTVLGLDVVFRQLDVSDDRSIDSFAESISKEFGSLDILVNNAAIAEIFEEYDSPAFRKSGRTTLKTNYYSILRLSDALLPLLRKAPVPRLVNVASGMGHKAFLGSYADSGVYSTDSLTIPQLSGLVENFISDIERGLPTINDGLEKASFPAAHSVYSYSKIAVIAATRVFARDPANSRVLINSVCPGYCSTEMNQHAGPRPPAEGAQNVVLLALLPEDSTVNGRFYENMTESEW
jgi:NAD(P)-dependent dehydrogenase (short-subunit alcohol dehydrogenase family)